MEIIDTHGYYGSNPIVAEENYTLSKLRNAQARLGKEGHDLKFLVMSAGPDVNPKISRVVRENPNLLLGGYLQVVPREIRKFPGIRVTPPEEIGELCQDREVRGLKLVTSLAEVSIDDPVVFPYARIAQESGIPFVFHCSASGDDFTSYEKNRRFVERHLDLKIVLAHFGGLSPENAFRGFKLAKEFKNVYLNTTGMSGEMKRYGPIGNGKIGVVNHIFDLELRGNWPKLLKHAMSDEDTEGKIVYGSDYPVLQHDLYPLNQIPEDMVWKIMDNAKDLFEIRN